VRICSADSITNPTKNQAVDARRIVCLGISMGGYRAMYLAALDDRIAAGA
jgi:hypothetical protein